MLQRERGDLPIADVAREEDPTAGGALGFVQMVAPDELDPPAGRVDGEAVEMRVFRCDAAEMAPHAAGATPDLGRRKLRQRAGEIVDALSVHREHRADRACQNGTEGRRPSRGQRA